MMHYKDAADALGLAKSNQGGNISELCRKGKIAGAEYIVSGWRVPEEWVYNRVLQQAATAPCPMCNSNPLSIVPHEDYEQAHIICPECALDISPRAFSDLRKEMKNARA